MPKPYQRETKLSNNGCVAFKKAEKKKNEINNNLINQTLLLV